jgi:hypothetical protein
MKKIKLMIIALMMCLVGISYSQEYQFNTKYNTISYEREMLLPIEPNGKITYSVVKGLNDDRLIIDNIRYYNINKFSYDELNKSNYNQIKKYLYDYEKKNFQSPIGDNFDNLPYYKINEIQDNINWYRKYQKKAVNLEISAFSIIGITGLLTSILVISNDVNPKIITGMVGGTGATSLSLYISSLAFKKKALNQNKLNKIEY